MKIPNKILITSILYDNIQTIWTTCHTCEMLVAYIFYRLTHTCSETVILGFDYVWTQNCNLGHYPETTNCSTVLKKNVDKWISSSSSSSSSSLALQLWVALGLLTQMLPVYSVLGGDPQVPTTQFPRVFLHPATPSWFWWISGYRSRIKHK